MFLLKDKTVLVTGAAGLLGKQHCIALASAGAMVILTDINQQNFQSIVDEICEAKPRNIRAYKLDVTNKDDVVALKDRLESEKIFVNVLVNNAAIDHKVTNTKYKYTEASRFEHFNPETFMTEIQVGLTGAMICAAVFGPSMAKRKDGIIINIASDLSIIAPDQRIYRIDGLSEELQPVKPVSYSVIKHGLHGLTKYLASYWGASNVRTNTLSPGGVKTDDMPDNFIKQLNELIPLGRIAELDEYHGTLIFLCSEHAKFMNGQNIVVDGGRSII